MAIQALIFDVFGTHPYGLPGGGTAADIIGHLPRFHHKAELPMNDPIRAAALEYHRASPPGKIAVVATKGLVNQRDLALAYSPGVAAACEEIVADPANAFRYTSRGNLVAVVTNGTCL